MRSIWWYGLGSACGNARRPPCGRPTRPAVPEAAAAAGGRAPASRVPAGYARLCSGGRPGAAAPAPERGPPPRCVQGAAGGVAPTRAPPRSAFLRAAQPGQRALPAEQLQRLEQRRRDPAAGDRDPHRAERVARLEPELLDQRLCAAPRRSPRSPTSSSAASASCAALTTARRPRRAASRRRPGRARSRPRRRTGSRACPRTRSAWSSARAPAARPRRAARAPRR